MSCEHLGAVREGDTLRSVITVEQVEYLPGGGGLVHLRSLVRADGRMLATSSTGVTSAVVA